MEDNLKYTLTVAEVATHYSLSARTIRNHLNGGTLEGVRLSGSWRCCWHDVWAAEQGPAPRGTRSNLYKTPLNSKKALALNWQVSERTVLWSKLRHPGPSHDRRTLAPKHLLAKCLGAFLRRVAKPRQLVRFQAKWFTKSNGRHRVLL